MRAQNDLRPVLVATLVKFPGVAATLKLNSANFTIKGKVFAFTKRNGVVLKLPPETVRRLVEAGVASLLVMGERTMKEWIVIRPKNKTEARKQLGLFKEAIAFVSSKA